MSAAAFVLAINLFVAGLFATAFAIVAVYHRSSRGAVWLALGYATGMMSPLFEFFLPFQQDHRLVSMAIFTSFLLALVACVIGLADHYERRRPLAVLGLVVVLSILVNIAILDMPRQSLVRGFLYQMPYTLVQAIGVAVLLGHRRWRPLDITLLALLAVSGLHFLGKPALAALIGSGSAPQDYLTSTYAALSQSIGAILLISNGLVMLLVMVRDMMADMTARSETDPLSQVLNRRGFVEHGDAALLRAARAGVPAVMIMADIDHFKAINDTYGHAVGDRVIAAFAAILRDIAEPRSVIGRIGGEEFAVFIPGANLMTGKLYAETARSAFAALSPRAFDLVEPITAAFGLAALRPGDTLSEVMRRADTALYQAKALGRNRVALFRDDSPRPFFIGRRSA
ncbi:GGDEF domain-containing protein [Devosia chinhatensis]|uniref:diguanylate cyclase n=1 Tax=Devosia chinhatensis TaxID=429727 RepID=A0A0F5FG09_9HYPH|nr:GGDEF domain-containing protein [Devosia chinhatensis]KKB07723.1 hypothetical protein VE26_13740 [Devosia chinhatensis]